MTLKTPWSIIQTIYKYHKNGKIKSKTTYEDGKKNGPFYRWYENGNLAMRSYYCYDKQQGECKIWDPNGNVLFKHNDGLI